MRIIQISPGTGKLYCGNCIRDNSLIAALHHQGHDAYTVPMYLPTMVEGIDTAEGLPIFFGGINSYLQQKSALFRKTPRWLDSIFDSPALLKWLSQFTDMTSARDLGSMTVSMLQGEEGKQVKELDRLVDWLKEQEKPDVVCLSNALLIGIARRVKSELGVPVVCTLQGEDGFLDSLPPPYCDDAWNTLRERAREIDAFVVISHYFAGLMRERMQLREEQVHVVHNGISLEGFEKAPSPPQPPVLGYLARMVPFKGLETLVDAFILLKKDGKNSTLKLRVAGCMTPGDKQYVDTLKDRLSKSGLAEDAEFFPNLSREEKQRFLQTLTVLSVPATYGEAFGLYVLESLAVGVPVVQPNNAAFPEVIKATGGGLLYEAGNTASLAEKINYLLQHSEEASTMGERGRMAVQENFSIEKMATNVLRVLEQVVN
jgi:glycosyltransferase involved in cell wall biosynthesis